MVRPVLVLSLLASPLLAQSDRQVTLGDRVRIVAPKAGYDRVTGTVTATTPDVLSISVRRQSTEVAVPRERIDRLFLSVGGKRHTAKGALLGGALGSGIALWFGPREDTAPGTTIETGRGSTKNLITTAIGGAALGALIGYATKTDSWMELSARPRMP
jgi:hypothetical protein